MQPEEIKNEYNVRDSQYFQGLPAFLQESILQATGSISNDEELRATAEQIMQRENLRPE